ncbi:Acetyltransferase (GNAT) family protein [Vibrio crassostreae]|nr:Acetyltransferase (GNAT) family protein [Vibrio crassostreae]CAK3437721.1 Acetyltransferase (GNAT) family protein [Vibrio crassostreae]CAK3943580.1 Acetyltransferase (GNAT) family protein [Vibrio crassostreae]
MKFMLIRPTRADITAQFSLIKPAFNKVYQAKTEFEFCCDAVKNKRASFYHLKGVGVSVRFVGFVTNDNDYLILAMTGKGLVKAAPYIIEAVKSQGYRSIKYHTVRRGMVRILKRFGFSITGKSEHDSVLSLSLEGC